MKHGIKTGLALLTCSVLSGIGSVADRMLILMDIEGLMSSPEMGLINAT